MEDVDARDRFHGDRQIEVEMSGFRVIDAQAVQEDEGLLEGGATQGEVRLDTVAAACLQVGGGIETDEIDQAVEEQRLFTRGEQID